MKKPPKAPGYDGVNGKVRAPHQRIEALEAARSNQMIPGRARCRRRFSASPIWAVPLVMAGMLLAPGVLGAQNKPDALFIDTNGNVGMGTTTPGFPLTFPDIWGDKISLWGQAGAHYGFGVLNNLLQIHASSKDADIVFGYGKSDSLTETMRIRGDGLLHFGGTTAASTRLPAGQGAYLGWNFLNGGTEETDFINNRGGGAGGFAFMNTDPDGSEDIKKSTLMVVTGDGRVGIGRGDAPPRGLLDVNGEIIAVNRLTLAQDAGETTTTWHVDNSDGLFRLFWQPNFKTVGTLALAATATGKVGIGIDNPGTKLDIDGTARVRGIAWFDKDVNFYSDDQKSWVRLHAGAYGSNILQFQPHQPSPDALPSDLRFKSQLLMIPSALDKIQKLRGVTYRWNGEALRYFTRDIETTISAGPQATAEENQKLWRTERERRYKDLAQTQVGVVAQDVEAVLPEAVTTDEAGYKSVRYNELIPLLIDALKELDEKVKDQSQLAAAQQQEIAQLIKDNRSLQEEVAELSAVKAQVARLEAAAQRLTATRSLDAHGPVALLSGSTTH